MALSKKIRFEVFKRDGFTCQYCGKKPPDVILHVDHIHPISKGGTNDLINLVTSCADCNLGKGARELSDNRIAELQESAIEDAIKKTAEIKEKKEQLEQYFEWQKAEKDFELFQISKLENRWCELTDSGFTAVGRSKAAKLIIQYGFNETYTALEQSCERHLRESEKKDMLFTHESLEKAFSNIVITIRYNRKYKDKPYLGNIHYIKGILRNRFDLSWSEQTTVVEILERLYNDGLTDLHTVQECAAFCSDIQEFLTEIEKMHNVRIPS